MRDLLGDSKKHKATAKTFREKFVFLNVYCRSVKEEHDPRGPKGPYQFVDKSVPVVVIKRWDGETLLQQLGWGGGVDRLAGIVDRAAKKNGPVAPPKALRPLLKAYGKAQKALQKKGGEAAAIRGLQKVLKLAAAKKNKKVFADGPPLVARQAKDALAKLQGQAIAAIEKAAKEHAADPAAHTKALVKLRSRFAGIATVKTQIADSLKKLKDAKPAGK